MGILEANFARDDVLGKEMAGRDMVDTGGHFGPHIDAAYPERDGLRRTYAAAAPA
jgi:hypothetical protein